ncbi:MAG: hypothetical protein K9J77_11625 [Rhodoferax sp.]|nr:hypothetical protein [Rhodoferax sp.]
MNPQLIWMRFATLLYNRLQTSFWSLTPTYLPSQAVVPPAQSRRSMICGSSTFFFFDQPHRTGVDSVGGGIKKSVHLGLPEGIGHKFGCFSLIATFFTSFGYNVSVSCDINRTIQLLNEP